MDYLNAMFTAERAIREQADMVAKTVANDLNKVARQVGVMDAMKVAQSMLSSFARGESRSTSQAQNLVRDAAVAAAAEWLSEAPFITVDRNGKAVVA